MSRNIDQGYVLVVVADGFEEIEAVTMLSLLRQAGLCARSVGLTSGPVGGVHGVCLMPDLTLSDLDSSVADQAIRAVVLPGGKQCLTRLETDPRVHRLLRQVVAQRGQIVTSREGLRIPRVAAVWDAARGPEADDGPGMPVLIREPGQSPEAFARDLIRKLKPSPRESPSRQHSNT